MIKMSNVYNPIGHRGIFTLLRKGCKNLATLPTHGNWAISRSLSCFTWTAIFTEWNRAIRYYFLGAVNNEHHDKLSLIFTFLNMRARRGIKFWVRNKISFPANFSCNRGINILVPLPLTKQSCNTNYLENIVIYLPEIPVIKIKIHD